MGLIPRGWISLWPSAGSVIDPSDSSPSLPPTSCSASHAYSSLPQFQGIKH
ncbi:MAG: hypothetical protein Q9217_001862 [Psora testacea]